MVGHYAYRNVRRWSKQVPGGDIFALDMLLFPINVGGAHWILAVIDMTKKEIQGYDSMHGSCSLYLDSLLQYLKDEHLQKKKTPLPLDFEWKVIDTKPNETPRQLNFYDCGVFVCMFAYFLSLGLPLGFTQDDINANNGQGRRAIALSILNGNVK